MRFRYAALATAILCSLTLTYLTITPPVIPTDWGRLDAAGVYVPRVVDTAWPSYALQVGLWMVTVGALIAFSGQRSAKDEKRNAEEQRSRGAERGNQKAVQHYLALVFITLVGFGVRGLGELPLIIDEIGFAAHASDILRGQHVPIFAPGHNANPSVYSWLVAGAMEAFGQNTFAIRLLPLTFGTLSIPALYALGRVWWSRRVGMIAAAFLATYPAHIFFSRMSLHNIVDPFFVMLALACLPHPLTPSPLRREGEQHRQWIMAGVLAGVAQYFYHGSRLVLVLMAVYVGLSVISCQLSVKNEEKEFTTVPQGGFAQTQRSQRKPTKRDWQLPVGWWLNVVWMALAFGLVTLPQFAAVMMNRLPLTGNEKALHLPADLGANSLKAALAWVGQKDVSPFWLSDAPLLEWPALLAFAVGLLVSLRRWRDPRYAVLIASILLTTIIGALPTATPLYVRYIAIVPAIGLLVAVGLSAVSGQQSAKEEKTQCEGAKMQRRKGDWVQVVAIALVCLQGVWAAGQQPGEALARVSESQWIEADLARQAANLPAGTAVVLVVPADFNPVQMITITHYVAAMGERRAVIVNRDGEATLAAQSQRIDGAYAILKSELNAE